MTVMGLPLASIPRASVGLESGQLGGFRCHPASPQPGRNGPRARACELCRSAYAHGSAVDGRRKKKPRLLEEAGAMRVKVFRVA